MEGVHRGRREPLNATGSGAPSPSGPEAILMIREVLLERRASRIEETQTVLLVQSDTRSAGVEPV